MQTRTWPYGTTRRATVVEPNWRRRGLPDGVATGQILKDELGEMHLCVGDCADFTAAADDTGTLTFTQGGPTGGYWKFTKDKETKS